MDCRDQLPFSPALRIKEKEEQLLTFTVTGGRCNGYDTRPFPPLVGKDVAGWFAVFRHPTFAARCPTNVRLFNTTILAAAWFSSRNLRGFLWQQEVAVNKDGDAAIIFPLAAWMAVNCDRFVKKLYSRQVIYHFLLWDLLPPPQPTPALQIRLVPSVSGLLSSAESTKNCLCNAPLHARRYLLFRDLR